MDELARKAAELGIEPAFVDARGVRRVVGEETLHRLVAALARPNGERSPPCVLLWRKGRSGPVSLPAAAETARWRLRTANGGTVAEGTASGGLLCVPDAVPIGRYDLEVDGAEAARLLVAPPAAYQPEEPGAERVWILAVQLYGVRSHRNWGHGDFTDLRHLVRLAAKKGAAGVGLNPLHALFDDRPQHASPYAPNSRLFLNPLYIDPEAIPEFPGLEACGLSGRLDGLRAATLVDYAAVAEAKRSALGAAFAAFRARRRGKRREAFEAFRAAQGERLARFAAFEVLRRRFAGVWWEWPEEWRRPNTAALARLRAAAGEEMDYVEYVQWVADAQLAACQAEARVQGMPIGLYLDLAVGVEPGGADAWSAQDAIVPQVEVGAPPDLLNTAGQAWGLAAFNPRALTAQAYEPFANLIAAAMRHAGAVRLDHVLGLNRFYLIPFGLGAQQGAYVSYPLQDLLATIAIESVRHRCVVIGEDLGTVPDDLRATLADWGIWSYLVMLFERRADGKFRHPHEYRREALVTFDTHDLPTFAGWLSDHDLRVKRAIGLDPGETDAERAEARRQLREVLHECLLGRDGPPQFVDVLRFLARTPSRLLAVALEDVLGLPDQPNVPGTVDEHPNWQRRLPVPLESLSEDARLCAVAAALREEGRGIAPSP